MSHNKLSIGRKNRNSRRQSASREAETPKRGASSDLPTTPAKVPTIENMSAVAVLSQPLNEKETEKPIDPSVNTNFDSASTSDDISASNENIDDVEDIQFVSQKNVKTSLEIFGDPAQRQMLMRERIYAESRIYLNNSNVKWMSIGIVPTSLGSIGGIKNFSTEIRIMGLKTFGDGSRGGAGLSVFSIGGLTEFLQLMRQLREIDIFRMYCVETKSAYKGPALSDGFIIKRFDFGSPVWSIKKKGTENDIKLGFVTIESILQTEGCIINIFMKKSPENYFKSYMDILNDKAKNRNLNILNYSDSNSFTGNFIEETYANFKDLFQYDVEQMIKHETEK